MRRTATAAIVGERLRREAWFIVFATSACALAAYLQRYDDPSAQLAGCLVFATLVGIRVALAQRSSGRMRDLALCEQSAPLYGRQLARATALVPCIIVTLGICCYWLVEAFFARTSPFAILLALAAGNASTIVALSATLRLGAARLLYVGVACIVGIIAFISASTLPAIGLAVCAVVAFIALRQYGEALARYDPVP